MLRAIPELITHNYDPAHGAFRNICNEPLTEAERILDEIQRSGKRHIRADYLERRLATERWLLRERCRRFGNPRLEHPIYFFLGNFADGKDRSRPNSIVIPLQFFPPDVLTFTYSDSMTNQAIAARSEQHLDLRKRYHGQVYCLTEIMSIVGKFGMPNRNGRSYDGFIEVQVWDSSILRKHQPATFPLNKNTD
jgi:hypothetical protein